MVIQIIPRITPEDLEKILKHLPEPSYAEFDLFGNFDYSNIFVQAEKVMPGLKLESRGRLSCRLKDHSKEKILDIYKKSYKSEKEETEVDINPRNISLHKIGWYLGDYMIDDNKVQIELTPWEVNIKYNGQEPKYISQMRKELSKTRVRLKIEVNK